MSENDTKTCVECGKSPLVFESDNTNDYEEYEPDPETGDARCFSCDLKSNPKRYN